MGRNSQHRRTVHPVRYDGVRAKKALGQHFLRDEDIAIEIVDSLLIPETGLDENPTVEGGVNVLEIGPGTGVLTNYLPMRDRPGVHRQTEGSLSAVSLHPPAERFSQEQP